ncbi:MAG: hypothetical protein WC417_05180, partial [Candidatus Omnitrophota bacterium]
MGQDNVTKELQLPVDLVKKWGESELPNGGTLRSIFTFDSVSFWDAIAVALAIHHVPKSLFLHKQSLFLLQRILTYLKRLRYEMIQMKCCAAKIKGHNWPAKPVFLFLGFQPYLYHDTIYPIVQDMAGDKTIYPVTIYDYLSL